MARQTGQKNTAASTSSPRRLKKVRGGAKSASARRVARPRRATAEPVKVHQDDGPAAVTQAANPPAPPKKPAYYEALAMYEHGVRALQRHDYEGAAAQFRTIIDRYPEERELQERSQLYLRVCERETARRPTSPQTPQERVYAATVALNAGDTTTALDHLRRALSEAPDNDHGHYIMAVALAAKAETNAALEHLRRAIALNRDNRALARQDPDLEPLRGLDGFEDLIDLPAGSGRGKARKRR